MRSTFKILFYVKKGSEKPNGNLPLMCRITVDGEVKQFSCKMDIPLHLWYEPYKAQEELNAIHKYFPMMKEQMRIGESAKFYSPEHKQHFEAKDIQLKMENQTAY